MSKLMRMDSVPLHCFFVMDYWGSQDRYQVFNPHPSYGWAFDDDVDGDGLIDSATATVTTGDYNMAAPNRHNNGANYLFKDGHVKWKSMRDWELNTDGLWTPVD